MSRQFHLFNVAKIIWIVQTFQLRWPSWHHQQANRIYSLSSRTSQIYVWLILLCMIIEEVTWLCHDHCCNYCPVMFDAITVLMTMRLVCFMSNKRSPLPRKPSGRVLASSAGGPGFNPQSRTASYQIRYKNGTTVPVVPLFSTQH